MYPQRELAELAQKKARLHQRIAVRRRECAVAAEGAVRPLVWVDAALALWRRISPLTKIALIPLGVLLGRKFSRPAGRVGAVLRWAPAVFQVIRGLRVVAGPGS